MVQDLTEFLSGYHASMRPTGRPGPLQGGLSGANLWAFDSPSGRLVARAWPPTMTPERLARIHAWLEEERVLPFVAVPLRSLEGATFRVLRGQFWELMPWKPGTPDLRERPDPHQLAAAGAGLAAFHARLAPRGRYAPSPGLDRRASELTRLLSGGLDRLERAIHGSPPTPLNEQAREWLVLSRTTAGSLLRETRAIAPQPYPLQPCLRDARTEHFLFQGNELTGLIDFGAMEVDNVSLDLARLLGEVPGLDRSGRSALLAAYMEVRPLDQETVGLIDRVMKISGFLVVARWLTWHYIEHSPRATEEILAERLRWSVEPPHPAPNPIPGA